MLLWWSYEMSWQETRNIKQEAYALIFASAAAHFSFNARFVNILKEMAIWTLNWMCWILNTVDGNWTLGFISFNIQQTELRNCSTHIKRSNAFFDKTKFDFASQHDIFM